MYMYRYIERAGGREISHIRLDWVRPICSTTHKWYMLQYTGSCYCCGVLAFGWHFVQVCQGAG